MQNFSAQLDAMHAPTTLAEIKAAVMGAGNAPLKDLVNSFNNADESVSLYGAGTSQIEISKFVAAIYQNTFHRVADTDGANWWVNEIVQGRVSKANAVLSIVVGAFENPSEQSAVDAATVATILAVASDFTASLDTITKINAFSGDAAAATSRAMLLTVVSDTDVIAFHEAVIVPTIANIGVDVVPTFLLTAGADSVNEGASVLVTLTTTHVTAGSTYTYTLSGVSADDVQSGSLTGTVVIGTDGKAVIPVTLKADSVTEGLEIMTVDVAGQAVSVSVQDTSTTPVPTYALTASGASVDEGSNVSFVLQTTNVAAGSSFTYTLSGVSASDVQGGSLIGTAVVGADGKAVIPVSLVADTTTEGLENLRVEVAGQSASVAVNDTSLTQSFTLAAGSPSIIEGDTGSKVLTFVLTLDKTPTSNVVVSYQTNGGTAQAGEDYVLGSGEVVFVAGQTQASVTVVVNGDDRDEIDETVQVTFTGQHLLNSGLTSNGVIADDDASPVFSSTATATVAENTVAAKTLVATDADSTTVSYAITGGADAALFNIDASTGALSFKAAPNFEAPADVGANNVYNVTVSAADSSGNTTTQSLALTVADANEAPTAVTLSGITASLNENTSTATRIKVADITATDDALGTNVGTLSGADAASFEIVGSALYLKAGVALNFESKAGYDVTVSVADAGVAGSTAVSTTYHLAVTDVNEAPTAVALANATTTIAENSDTAARTKVADIAVTDDALGINGFSVAGADAASFEIIGNALYLKAGVALNFESKASYAVTVSAADAGVAGSVPVSTTYTLNVSDVNEAPTVVALANATAAIAENTSTATRTKVADIAVTDDALGTNGLTVAGADAASFEIVGNALYLKAGVALNFESKASYAVNVVAADASLTGSVSASYTLSVTDVNEAPTGVSLSNTVAALSENINTALRTKVADIVVADDALGTNALTVGGADAGSFEIVGTALYLKAGVALDKEVKSTYDVTVSAVDAGVAGSSAVNTTYTLTVNNVNEAPTAVADAAASVVTGNVVSINVVANDTDPELQAVTLTGTPTATAGSGSVAVVGGQLQFTALAGFVGPATISYSVTDGTNVVTSSVLVNVLEPVLTAAASVNEGGTITYTLKGAPNVVYAIDVTSTNVGEIASGIRQVTTNATGDATLALSVTADRATEALAQSVAAKIVGTQAGATLVSVTDSSMNNIAPVAQNGAAAATEGAVAVTGQLVATDADLVDAGHLTFSTASVVPGFTLNANGSYTFDATNAAYDTLAAGATDVRTVTYTVNDNATTGTLGALTNTKTLTITVTGTNDAPVAVAKVDVATEAAGTVTGNLVASDVDTGAVLTFAAATGQAAVAGLTVNANGSYSFDTTNAAYNGLKAGQTQVISYNYTATDDHSATSNSTLTITVTGTNDAPVATVIPAQVGTQDAPVTINAAAFFSDVDLLDVLTYSATGLPTGLTINATTGVISGTPTLATIEAGSPAIVVSAFDGLTTTAAAAFALTIAPSYTVAASSVSTVNEGASIVYTITNSARNNGDILNYSITSLTTNAADFTAGLTGQAVFNSNHQATITIGVTADAVTEAVAESFSVDFSYGGVAVIRSGSVSVVDSSQTGNLDIALTTGADTGLAFTGGIGDDTFNGRTVLNSLGTADEINGGTGGTDTVTGNLSVDGGVFVRPKLTGVEVIDITNSDVSGGVDTVTVDMSNTDSSITTVRSTESTDKVVFENLQKVVRAEKKLTAQDLTLAFTDASLASASDNITVALDNSTGGGLILQKSLVAGVGANGVETITIENNVGQPMIAVGNAVTVTNAIAGGAYNVVVTQTSAVGADLTLTIAAGAAGEATTINASAAKGALNVTNNDAASFTYAGGLGADTLNVGAQTATGITNTEFIISTAASTITVNAADTTNVTVTDDAGVNTDIITLALGNDTVNAGAGVDNINVGAGTNRVVISAVNLEGDGVVGGANDDTIAAGAGTDTLAITSGAVANAQFVSVSGFEVLELQTTSSVTLDTLGFAAGIRSINGASLAGVAGDNNIVLEEQATDLTIAINGGETTNLVADTDYVWVQDSGLASAGVFTLNVEGVEVVDASGGANVSGLKVNVTGGTQGVTVYGSTAFDSVVGGAGSDYLNTNANAALTTDFFNGMGGSDTLEALGGAATIVNVETVNFTGVAAQVTVQAGDTTNVTVTDNAANNSIVLADGVDTVNLAAGSDNVNLGNGATNRVVVAVGDLTGGIAGTRDTITGGTGTDTLALTGGAAAVDAQFAGVSSVEVLELQTTTGATLDTNAFAGGIRTINGANAAANSIILEEGAANLTLTISGGTGVGDIVTVQDTVASAGKFTLSVSGVETITAANANVSGVSVTVADAGAVNFTGSASADTFFGGAGNDTITGGDGTDSMVGGAGDDLYILSVPQFNADLDTITEQAAGGNDTVRLTSASAFELINDAGFNGRFVNNNMEALDLVTTGATTYHLGTSALGADLGGLGVYVSQTGIKSITANAGVTLDLLINNQLSTAITVNGNNGADKIDGTNMTVALTYNDLGAATGNDSIYGGSANDTIVLANNDNTVVAGAGNDTITLGTGNDSVDGGIGDDAIVGGVNVTDADTIVGGTGTDSLTLSSAAGGTLTLTAANKISGIETITLASQGSAAANLGFHYAITVDNDNDVVAADLTDVLTVNGSALLADADSTIGGVAPEFFDFNAQAVTSFKVNVIGGASADSIIGGNLADTLTGGEGADTITGNGGADSIVLTETTKVRDLVRIVNAAAGTGDTITGFDAVSDSDAITAGVQTANQDQIELAYELLTNGVFTHVAGVQGGDFSTATVITVAAAVAGGADTALKVSAFLQNSNLGIVGNERKVFVLHDGTDTYLWAYATDLNPNVNSTEFTLLAKLNGVVGLGVDNFAAIPTQFTVFDDVVTLNAAAVGPYNGDTGNDILTLANGGNTFTVSNVESIVGGTGADIITLNATLPVSLALGALDRIIVSTGTNLTTINSGGVTTAPLLTMAGTVTMSQVQHEGFTGGITAVAGADAIILTTAGTVTASADIENYSVVEGSTVTVGTAVGNLAQIITETGAVGTVSTIILGNGTYTGVYTGIDTNDVIRVGTTTDVILNTGLNAGVVMDFNSVSSVGTGLTLNATQNGIVTFSGAAVGSQTVTVSAVDTFSANDVIEKYSVVEGSIVTVGTTAGNLAQVIDETGAVGTVSTVILGNGVYTGAYTGIDAIDVIRVGTTTNVVANTGLNAGAVMDFNSVSSVTTGLTLNATQNGIVTFANATTGSQTVTVSAADTFTADANIEKYSVVEGSIVTVGTAAGNLAQVIDETGAVGTVSTVILGAGVYTGVYTGIDAIDVIQVGTTTDVILNTGLNTGAVMDFNSVGSVGTGLTLNATQNGIVTFSGAAVGSQTVTVSAVDTFTADANIEKYSVVEGSIVTVGTAAGNLAQVIDETGAVGTVSTVILGNGVYTGAYTGIDAIDVIRVGATTDVILNTGLNAGAVMDFNSVSSVGTGLTLNATQNGIVTFANATTGSQTVTVSAIDTFTADANIEKYSVVEGSTVTVGTAAGNLAQVIDETGAVGTVSTVILGNGTYTGAYTGIDAIDVIQVGTTTNVAANTGLDAGAVIDFNNAASVGAGVTLNATQNGVVTFANAAGAQTVTVSAADSFTASAVVETYNLANGVNNFTFAANTAQAVVGGTLADTINVTLGAANVATSANLGVDVAIDTVVITNTAIANMPGETSVLTMTNFNTANDVLQLRGADTFTGAYQTFTSAAGAALTSNVTGGIWEVESTVGQLVDPLNAAAAKVVIGNAIGLATTGAGDHYAVLVYTTTGAAVYEITTGAVAAADFASTDIAAIELVGVLTGMTANAMSVVNFG